MKLFPNVPKPWVKEGMTSDQPLPRPSKLRSGLYRRIKGKEDEGKGETTVKGANPAELQQGCGKKLKERDKQQQRRGKER